MSPEKSIAVMQPYFLPYIGYWQLIKSVDEFVIFDDVNYIKKGFINRNKIFNGKEEINLVLPISKASQNRKIMDHKYLIDNNIIKTINSVYSKAPNYKKVSKCLEEIINFGGDDLVSLLEIQIQTLCALLGIKTKITKSSSYQTAETGKEKIVSLCKITGSTVYKNAIGGRLLYNSNEFEVQNIALRFIRTLDSAFSYSNGSRLSIVDLLMRLPEDEWSAYLDAYEEVV